MHRDAAHERLFAIDRIAGVAIERDIGGEFLVRVEAQLPQAQGRSERFGMAQQPPAIAAAWQAGATATLTISR